VTGLQNGATLAGVATSIGTSPEVVSRANGTVG
jgi:hypothetical protein